MIYLKKCPNQTCDYSLITPNQQTLCIETDTSLAAGNGKLASKQLQNNSVNGAIKHVIMVVIFITDGKLINQF